MKIFRYILESLANFKLLIIGQLVCVLLIAIDGNLRPYIIKLIIDQSMNFKLENFVKLSSVFLLSQLIMVISNAVFDWLGTRFHTNYRSYTAHKFFDKITSYKYKFFQETQVGTITARINDAFNVIPMLIFTAIKIFINFILFVLISIAILSKIDELFVLVLLIWITIFMTLTVIFYYKYEPLNTVYAKVRPKMYGFLSDYFSNILAVRFFGNQNFEKQNLQKITEEFVTKSIICGIFLRNYYALHGIIVVIYMMIILTLLGYLSIHHKISPGDFGLVFMVNYKIVDLLFEISNNLRDFVINCGVVTNAIEILDGQEIIKDKQNDLNFEIKEGEITFNKVNFSYNKNNLILKNISLSINPREKIGLVGYSGSGKTTFINLILRLYDIDSGQILIDGKNIEDITHESLLKSVAIVDQEPALFHRTILENVQYGRIDALEQEVIHAIKNAKADEFIAKMKEGYQTIVGERGIKLSGGQRQRIAIARAILKSSPIFIFDEATSQLDSITENYIRKNLQEIIKDKTAIIVAHRLSTLMQVDRIIVFDDGKIIEQGAQKELLAQNGVFKTLWNAQVNGFLPTKKPLKV